MKRILLSLFSLVFLPSYLHSAELAKDGTTGRKIAYVRPVTNRGQTWNQIHVCRLLDKQGFKEP